MVAPMPSWKCCNATNGVKCAPTPTNSDASSNARKAFILRQVTKSTSTAMAPTASRRR